MLHAGRDSPLGVLEIFDVLGADLGLFWRSLNEITMCAKVNETNYPGLVTVTLIINAPATFPTAYRTIKPMLPTDTQKRIEVIPGDPRPRIHELIDPENLPREEYRRDP